MTPGLSPRQRQVLALMELEPELWAHVTGNTGRSPEARKEAAP
jgi:hypothetical protein